MLENLVNYDTEISRNLINFMSSNPRLHYILYTIANSDEVKGVISALVFWYLWFDKRQENSERRYTLLAMALSTSVAIFIGIVLAQVLPFRDRPRADPDVAGDKVVQTQFFEEWSSMPSDHAVMFFAIATGFFLVSRKAGMVALFHAAVVVCLPRILIGFHYASDILIGGLIGITASLVVTPLFSKLLKGISFISRTPERFIYMLIFLITFSFATMFNSIRSVGEIMKSLSG